MMARFRELLCKCAIIALVMVLLPLVARAGGWPTIVPLTETFHFPDATKASVSISILKTDGQPAYRVDCHQFGYDDPEFDYSGDFECRLSSLYSKETHSTLFTDEQHQSRDWQSRARFLSEELVGQCAEYPEYGRTRAFLLRGMRIVLELSNISLDRDAKPRPLLRAFDFRIVVRPSRRAVSSIAAPIRVKEPPFKHPGDDKDHSLDCDKP
jgi:hypothetical protein